MGDWKLEEYIAPSWLSTRQTTKDADAHFRDAILYQLADSPPETVLQDTRKTITTESLSECSAIYSFELYKMLKKMGVDIPKEENKYEYVKK